jgi:hypothetical protein
VRAIHVFVLVANSQELLDDRLPDAISDRDQGYMQLLYGVGHDGLISFRNALVGNVPQDRAVPRVSGEVAEVIGIHLGLIQPENVEWNSPRLEHRDDGLKLSTSTYQKAARVFPLVGDHK